MITVSNLSKKYGKKLAVDNLSLEVGNELFVFLGPNGAGKTTTVKMMTGLLMPTSGSVVINGMNLLQNPLAAKRQFGLVPERPYLYEKLTGIEFIKFMASMYKVPADEAFQRMTQLFDIFEMTDQVQQLIENFSQGMKQKTAIIGAMIHNPQVLFLDEPTIGLDPQAAKNLKDLLKGLVEKGTTIFMTTHILELAERMCDRIGIINNGKLQALGTLDELFAQVSGQAATLEDVFLELTGSRPDQKVTDFLKSV